MSNLYGHESLKLELNDNLLEPSSPFLNYPVEVTASKGHINLNTTLNVLAAGNSESGNEIVVGPPWSEYVQRPDSIDRYRVMADSCDTFLKVVDIPGMNAGSAGLPVWLRRAVASGNFDTVAHLQWQALIDNHQDKFKSVSLLGYSMGAHVVAALARTAPEQISIDKIILWEAVSQRQHIAKLGLKFAAEERRSSRYRKENPDWMQEPVDLNAAFPGTKKDYLSYSLGISKGSLAASILEGVRKGTIAKDMEVVVISGSDSIVSSAEDNHKLVNFLRRAAGMTAVRQYELIGESHSMINSAPRMADALSRIIQ